MHIAAAYPAGSYLHQHIRRPARRNRHTLYRQELVLRQHQSIHSLTQSSPLTRIPPTNTKGTTQGRALLKTKLSTPQDPGLNDTRIDTKISPNRITNTCQYRSTHDSLELARLIKPSSIPLAKSYLRTNTPLNPCPAERRNPVCRTRDTKRRKFVVYCEATRTKN